MRTSVVAVLLLSACGSAVAPSVAKPGPVTSPPPVAASTTVPIAAPTAFPARLALTTKDGTIVTFGQSEDAIVTPGVMAPTGKVVVSADSQAGRTTVEWHHLRTDEISASVILDGDLHVTAVGQDGKLAALVGSAGNTTTVVLATPSEGEVRRWQFDSVLVPEAFSNAFAEGSDLPIGVFVIEYLAEHTYRVRVIDTSSGTLGLPLNLRDKSQTVDEVMTAVSRTAVFEPTHQLLFTLYQDASEGGEQVGSFIHTLGLFNGVWCLDVPPALGLADHRGALAVNPAGSRLFAASSTGGVAGYDVSDITDLGPEMPAARATTALGATAARVAVGASQHQLVVALGGSLFRLDPATLAVDDSFKWDMDVEALTTLDDGSVVMVGSGRITMVSADDQIVAERPLPAGIAEVVRVAAV